MPWHWDGGWHMGWMALWWVLGLVLLAALFWAIASAGRRTAGGPDEHHSTPDDILRERYARGEIDRETFERMREDLHR